MNDYKNTPDGKVTAKKYADIIHLSRPASSRPKMDHVQRAKIFAPFDALRGFDAEIDIAQSKSREVERIELSDEQKEQLSDKLMQIHKGMRLDVQYFMPGRNGDTGTYVTAKGIAKRIDPIERRIEIQENTPDTTGGKIEKVLPTVIRFDDLLDISSPDTM